MPTLDTTGQVRYRGFMKETKPNLNLLAAQIRAKMEARGLSIRAAADEAGIDRTTFFRLTKGSDQRSTPRFGALALACRWVGMPLDQLSPFWRDECTPIDPIVEASQAMRRIPGLETELRLAILNMLLACE